MRTMLSVTTPAKITRLTTRERVKLELNISDNASDQILNYKIEEASGDIEAALGFRVPRENVVETFWHEAVDQSRDALLLNRYPVSSIASIVVDDQTIDSSLYRLDAATGQLYALNGSGYPFVWYFSKAIVATYAGGYLLPSQPGRDLPAGIEGACVELLKCYWFWRDRDPTVKSEEAPGIMRYDYWVGSVGEAGELPPGIVARLAPYRRPVV
jgi:hypothetical protein